MTPKTENNEPLYIVFDGNPGHQSPAFVEVENEEGKSRSIGHWQQNGEYWKLGPVYAAPVIHQENEWIPVEKSLPDVALGGELHCFLLLNLKNSGRQIVVDAYFINKPKDDKWGEEIDAPDWALESECDGYVGMVGWAEQGSHPDFHNFFYPFDTTHRDIVAWMPVAYPAPPKSCFIGS